MGVITHVDEIIGLDKKIKAVAGEGGGADSGMIAEAYDPNLSSPISVNDLKIYDNTLYRCKQAIPVNAGEFDPTMWDQVPDFDETATYNTGDNVEYAASVYRCDEDNVTGEFDLTKWTAVPQDYPLYDERETYYAGFSKVTYGDHYYVAGSNYQQSGVVGPFNHSKWEATTVEAELDKCKLKTFPLIKASSSITTDNNGYLRWSITANGVTTPIAIYGGNNQPNTGAYFELCATSYMSSKGTLVVKVTDDTGAPLKNTQLNAYMAHLLTVVYYGTGTITAVTQVID